MVQHKKNQTYITVTRDGNCSIDALERTTHSNLDQATKIKSIQINNVDLLMNETYF